MSKMMLVLILVLGAHSSTNASEREANDLQQLDSIESITDGKPLFAVRLFGGSMLVPNRYVVSAFGRSVLELTSRPNPDRSMGLGAIRLGKLDSMSGDIRSISGAQVTHQFEIESFEFVVVEAMDGSAVFFVSDGSDFLYVLDDDRWLGFAMMKSFFRLNGMNDASLELQHRYQEMRLQHGSNSVSQS